MNSLVLRGLLTASLVLPLAAAVDTLQLKDKATVTGTILTEKKDLVVLDIGYTVLTIPKKEIVKIIRAADAEAKLAKVPATATPARPGPATPLPPTTPGIEP